MTFRKGQTVRLGSLEGRPFGTPSQRRELWYVVNYQFDQDEQGWRGESGGYITIARKSDPDALLYTRRSILIPSSLLELMAARVDESEAAAGAK